MPGLYREDSQGQGQPNSWAGEFGVEAECANHILYQVGTEGCWENLDPGPL